MISDINEDSKEIKKNKEGTILNLFYDNQINENKSNVDYLLKKENIETSKQIISNKDVFNELNNNQKLLIAEIIVKDKGNIQPYLKKIIESADHELVFLIAKNKNIYHNLNSENKKCIKGKLNKNPWINQNDLNFL
jgi:hypothetical protein